MLAAEKRTKLLGLDFMVVLEGRLELKVCKMHDHGSASEQKCLEKCLIGDWNLTAASAL